MTFFNHFCERIPRDGACVVGRHRSEGFVREPLKISNICPSIIFVGRTHATDTESAKTDRKFKYERSSETYIGFSDDLFVSIIFVDRVHATALVLSTNFVAWASPASHLRFQTTCPLIIFVGRTHATDTVPVKTDRKFKHKRSSETLISSFRRPFLHLPTSAISGFTSVRFVPPVV